MLQMIAALGDGLVVLGPLEVFILYISINFSSFLLFNLFVVTKKESFYSEKITLQILPSFKRFMASISIRHIEFSICSRRGFDGYFNTLLSF